MRGQLRSPLLYFSFFSGCYILNSCGRLRRFVVLFGAFRAHLGAYWSWMTPLPQNWGAFSNPTQNSADSGRSVPPTSSLVWLAARCWPLFWKRCPPSATRFDPLPKASSEGVPFHWSGACRPPSASPRPPHTRLQACLGWGQCDLPCHAPRALSRPHPRRGPF